MPKLYHHLTCAASRYVRILLNEYAISAELVSEAPWSRREMFLSLNPAGTLPVMVVSENQPICGGIVIGEFLDETRGAMINNLRLMPNNHIFRAEVRRLVEWFLNKMHDEVIQYLVGERVHKLLMDPHEGNSAPDAAIIRVGRINFRSHLKYISWLSASRDWLAGSQISYADIAAASSLSILDYLGEIDWDNYPVVKDWFVRVKSRPSFRSILEDNIIGIPPAPHYINLDF